jgi:hypothetical protein
MQLVDGSCCPTKTRFAALSHAWGSQPFVMLTNETISAFQSGIDLHSLPKTFKDAIYVTQKIGLNYIWIDALCILQDSAEDWTTQAAQMGMYYRHAYVTLSALSSTGAHSGFLHPRQQKLSLILENGLRLRRERPQWHEVFHSAPLSKRAWVLQERLLSTRIIHFEKNEILWECSTTSAREGSYYEAKPPLPNNGGTSQHFKRCLVFQGARPETDTLGSRTVMRRWDCIIRQYSTLNLTYERDIFPALAGIAQKVSEATGYTYIAGLWQENIHAGLLWHADAYTERPLQAWRAPSWSWASLGGPLEMVYDPWLDIQPSAFDAQLIDCSSIPSLGSDVFGPIQSAHLVLDAYYFTVWCRSSSNGSAPYSDPYLCMVIDIFDEKGIFIGTGYWDRMPDEPSIQVTAIVVCKRLDVTVGDPVTNFLLTKDMGDYTARIGIGRTVDPLRMEGTTALELERCGRKRFLLR